MIIHHCKYAFLFSLFFISLLNAAQESPKSEKAKKMRLSWYLGRMAKDIVQSTPEQTLDFIDDMEEIRNRFRKDAESGSISLIEDFDETIFLAHRKIARRCLADNVPFLHALDAEFSGEATRTDLARPFLERFAKHVSNETLLTVSEMHWLALTEQNKKYVIFAMILRNSSIGKGKLVLNRLIDNDSKVDKSWGEDGNVEHFIYDESPLKVTAIHHSQKTNDEFPFTVLVEPGDHPEKMHIHQDGKDVYWSGFKTGHYLDV